MKNRASNLVWVTLFSTGKIALKVKLEGLGMFWPSVVHPSIACGVVQSVFMPNKRYHYVTSRISSVSFQVRMRRFILSHALPLELYGVHISVFLGRVFGLFTFGTNSAYRLKSVHRVFENMNENMILKSRKRYASPF